MLAKNFDAASDAFQRALQLSPDDADINDMMAYFLLCMGRANEAIERSRKAMRASPLFHPASLHETIGMAFMMARQYEEAIKSFAAISSPYYYIHVYLAGCLAKLGHLDEARMHARLASELNPDWRKIDWGYQYTKGEYSEHEREIAQLAQRRWRIDLEFGLASGLGQFLPIWERTRATGSPPTADENGG